MLTEVGMGWTALRFPIGSVFGVTPTQLPDRCLVTRRGPATHVRGRSRTARGGRNRSGCAAPALASCSLFLGRAREHASARQRHGALPLRSSGIAGNPVEQEPEFVVLMAHQHRVPQTVVAEAQRGGLQDAPDRDPADANLEQASFVRDSWRYELNPLVQKSHGPSPELRPFMA